MEGEAEERGKGSEGRVMGKERIAWRDAKGKIKGLPMFSLSFSRSLSLSHTLSHWSVWINPFFSGPPRSHDT